ncbi:hypothetical protein BXZ70DRAFT_106027 [Cristinia sonorae]|uniref:Uncharacterized protein n=1 Tax=Cristinia sonorae TaxID=1940300 RepID=A0A8K0UR52_9AGAR|nr:hypothetical protein BXZ70DRAFT_106027 [Cristinia sonorae]
MHGGRCQQGVVGGECHDSHQTSSAHLLRAAGLTVCLIGLLLSGKYRITPMGPKLPIELWEKIIDAVKGEKSLLLPGRIQSMKYWSRETEDAISARRDLRAYCLVHRAWVPRCRYHLFQVVHIGSTAQLTHALCDASTIRSTYWSVSTGSSLTVEISLISPGLSRSLSSFLPRE